ncbi:hypothetical protein BMS3Bbin11_00099 [bacterium BMS3Bbin11]|nr:hypothetical protein BMS3Abin11_01848 [bacterium BMS3Abin11]GBE45020.1 hypothetical protein BMS3Bbin11_00099 [bacterium BMS3Bbin11]HDH07964.1 hypothetical protein [Gammaproteobacteria bacterium]HDZ78960.1 hypothetical protein [Gammaproteobacteria bacterium]
MTHRHFYDLITLSILLGCSFVGVAITNISPASSRTYWLAMVPVFFLASLVTEWPHVRNGKYSWKTVIWNHSLQWLALLAAIQMVFIIQQIGRLNNETTGLILLLLFALSTFIAGIRMGWVFRLAGLFLATGLLVLAYLERYLWALVLVAIFILVIHHFVRRYNKQEQPE